MTWKCINYDHYVVICPLDDKKEHTKGTVCHCKPVNENNMFIHRSYDLRELLEPNAVYYGNPNA